MTKRDEKRATPHATASGRRALRSLTERQLEAYLVSRDTIRRIQRTTELLLSASPPRPSGAARG